MLKEKSYLSVSNLNSKIKNLIERDLDNLWVKGEISNFHLHPSSGHMYFTLKDNNGEIRCVMFRGSNQKIQFKPNNGVEVRIFGSVTIYEQRGQIQLKVNKMEPDGVGDLHLAYELLKKRLLDEGLFNEQYKKNIPKYPKSIGIITSGSSAAFQDIIKIIKRRSPQINIILRSVIVQGDKGAKSIVEGIEDFNKFGQVDTIILGRGGGSIEDLWCFNEEAVVRSIFKSSLPIISGIGHETDFTISDFVSDLRAATPSAAAELVSLARHDIIYSLKQIEFKISNSFMKIIENRMLKLDYLENRLSYLQPNKQIKIQSDGVVDMQKKLIKYIKAKHEDEKQNIDYLLKQLISLSPKEVLNRGYAIAFSPSGDILRSSDDAKTGDKLRIQTGDGSLIAKKIS
jgi:exodeoxyribonuclease VII large subunit